MSEDIDIDIDIDSKSREDNEKGLVSGREKVLVQQMPIGLIFTLSCLVGGLFIFLGVTFSSNLLALICPILIMLGYWAYIRKANTGMPLSVIGDSYYYMGFIFTMFSLVISLLSLSNNDGININSLVGSFGSALLTTISGLILRLATTSFSVQTKEKQKNLEFEIERSLLEFSAQLETLTTEVSLSLTKVHSETQKVLMDSSDGYRTLQKQLATTFKKSMVKDQEQISNSMIELSNRISLIDVKPDLISKPVEAALTDLVQCINDKDTYKTITKDVVKANRALSTQISKSGSFMKAHVENLDISLSNSLKAHLDSYEESMNQVTTSIIVSLDSFTDIKLDTEEKLKNQMLSLSSSFKGITDELTRVKMPLTKSVDSINDGINKFSINIDKLNQSSSTLMSSFGAVKNNEEYLSEMNTTLQSFNSSVSIFNTQLNESVQISKDTNTLLLGSASSVHTSSEKMLLDIDNVYSELTDQMKSLRV